MLCLNKGEKDSSYFLPVSASGLIHCVKNTHSCRILLSVV